MVETNLPSENLKPEVEDSLLKKNEILIVSLICLLALAVRIAYIVELSRKIYWGFPLVDAKSYHAYAVGDVSLGTWLSPLYGWVLRSVYLCTGSDLWAPRLLQAVAGTGTVLLIYLAAKRLGGVTVAVVAGILAALYGPFVFYGAHLMKTTYATFFLMLAFTLLLEVCSRKEKEAGFQWPLLIMSGAAFGFGALFRGNILLLVPVIVVWMLVAGRKNIKTSALAAVVLIAAAATGPVVVIAVNTIRAGKPIGLSTSAGFNFFEGNSEYATGYHADIPDMPRTAEGEEGAAKAFAALELGKSAGDPVKVDRYYRRKAFDWILGNPGAWLDLTLRKLYYFLNRLEIPDNYNYSFMASNSYTLGFLPVGYWLVAPLSIAGIIFLWPRKRKSETQGKPGQSGISLLLLFMLGYAGAVILFYVTGRMRLPAAPFLIVLASLFIVKSFQLVRAVPKAAIVRAVILAGAVLLVWWPRPPATLGYDREHFVIATFAVERAKSAQGKVGQINYYDIAVKQYEEALKYSGRGAKKILHQNALVISRLVYRHEKTAKWGERIKRHEAALGKLGDKR
ncbi:MAG: phospholipid carrier-dependent glycosyltransferase [Planctomycetota bacterium]|nr:MAG: phospholipid carrier-dependent glycosyltransferase [Planctomycetota bacterium]